VSASAAAARTGLTNAEAERRLAERGPVEPPPTSRSYASIVRANVLTVFNLILLVFGVLTIAFGEWQDALFLGILVTNAGIGIYQEIRATEKVGEILESLPEAGSYLGFQGGLYPGGTNTYYLNPAVNTVSRGAPPQGIYRRSVSHG